MFFVPFSDHFSSNYHYNCVQKVLGLELLQGWTISKISIKFCVFQKAINIRVQYTGAYPGGMHRMHVHPPSPPCASPPPPAMCILPQPERLVMRKNEAVVNKKKMQVCLPKHNYILSTLFENLRNARDKTLVCKNRSELKLVKQSY